MVGENAPPMHPNCRCSTAPYMDPEEFEEWLEGFDEEERNKAKIQELIHENGIRQNTQINPQHVVEGIRKSQVGRQSMEYIESHNIPVQFDNVSYAGGARGDSGSSDIRIFTRNIKSSLIAEQTVIHETTHIRFHIGQCQHAEAICFAYEKMHKENRDYLVTVQTL